MAHYRDLKAWQLAHELALRVAEAVDHFPRHERFELSSQLRRASLSVPTNIVEGQSRFGAREALRFCRIAGSSLAEVDYLLFFALERGYLSEADHRHLDRLREHTARVLSLLIQALHRTTRKGKRRQQNA
jgi:four helix bundle protein